MRSRLFPGSILYLLAIIGLALRSHSLAAATPQEVDAAIQKGVRFLSRNLAGEAPKQGRKLGEIALAGLALLECGIPGNEPVLKEVTACIREAACTETQTYHLALYVLYLDRLGDPADVPIIQMLAVRLLAGQSSQGGWTYQCPAGADTIQTQLRNALLTAELRAGDVGPGPGKQRASPSPQAPARDFSRLHPAVQRYAQQLQAEFHADRFGRGFFRDDNSNTQFAILGLWAARKHGVPVEEALDRVQKRFLATQCANGGWPYAGTGVAGSPSMTCAGLLGLATAVGRRQERLLRHDASPLVPPAKPSHSTTKGDEKKKQDIGLEDPFFQPPPEPHDPKTVDKGDPFFLPPAQEKLAEKSPRPQKALPPQKEKIPFAGDPCAPAIGKGLANLAAVLEGGLPQGKGKHIRQIAWGRDYYFLWSLERVGVIFGLEKIGQVDWYQYGADLLIPAQNPNGSWGSRVDTAFALLFLARSNVVRDLSRVVQGKTQDTELRAGGLPPVPVIPDDRKPPNDATSPWAHPVDSVRPSQGPTSGGHTRIPPPRPDPGTPSEGADLFSGSGARTSPPELPPITLPRNATRTNDTLSLSPIEDAAAVVEELLRTPEDRWTERLAGIRDGKGGVYTQVLLLAIRRVGEEKVGVVRQALAERLTRMTADTLRQYLKGNDPELRRAAVLAMAMKDDKAFIPDMITALLDDEEMVVRAARAGLKSLTGQDFGPPPGADLRSRSVAAQNWLKWFRQQQRQR
jgi:hypothetical protein